MAIRLNILSHHYRADWEWFDKDLQHAVESLSLWRDAFACESGTADQSQEIFNFLVNDLDTPSAIAAIDSWASQTLISQKDYAQHEASQENAAQALDPDSPESMQRTVDALLGIV
jgi:L-cysteine:1D-myo-inositol 2-amino-2-deoxy-alpha-D-glucopyranoside ligase